MKTFLHKFLLSGAVALAAVAIPQLRAASSAAATGDKLYVTIDYDDPIAFERFRYGFNDGKDLILGTLRAKAAEMAQAAHWATQVVVLDEKTQPPEGAPVLRLTWSHDAVLAEYLPNKDAKAYYLGVVNRTSLAFHPTPAAVITRINSAPNSLARRDERIRADTELNLYLALGLVEKHLSAG